MIEQPSLPSFFGTLATDRALWPDFLTLCGFGGRQAGSAGEAAARDWAAGRLAAIAGGTLRRDPVRYQGWACQRASVTDLATGKDLPATALLAAAPTPPGGLELDVVDCARGGPEQIALAGEAVRGRAVLVRHEYPFASWTIHRRIKLAAAIEAGAAAFLIVQPEPGVGPISGSAGMAPGRMIPAFGLSAEAGAILARPGSRVRLHLDTVDEPGALTETIVLDIPGQGAGRIVLSAHIDGHAAGESALDNGTGVAAALALARAIAPAVSALPQGLMVCLFSAEEWALTGSREWLAAMPSDERDRLKVNLNLDSIAGSSSLTALTSGFAALGPFVKDAVATAGLDVAVHEPLMTNSDHANFAAHGIPALRLLAGFDEPASHLRYLLTRADTPLLTNVRELKASTLTAGTILWKLMNASSAELDGLRLA